MSVNRIVRNVLGGTIPLVLLTIIIAGCGSSTATGSTVASTPTATACLSTTTGTIQNVGNTTLQITSLQGKTVQATFTSKTIFMRQATLTNADLKVGMLVSVAVTQNTDNTYSAQTISIRTSLTRPGGFTRGAGSGLCNGQRPRRTGTPGTFGGPGFGGAPGTGSGGRSFQTISGTISQVNGNSLVVTDTSNNDFSMTITSTTRMTQQQTVTASDLRTGAIVTITGSANSQGVISASSISILQGIPFRRITPKLTPTTTGA
ncbi:MAG TPA: DUF5666 domain-containing protein [Ktedonobacteraceae bacterium]|nr:DUF5666 domain-containing protein [Ktedonobacteraceae bacterium]